MIPVVDYARVTDIKHVAHEIVDVKSAYGSFEQEFRAVALLDDGYAAGIAFQREKRFRLAVEFYERSAQGQNALGLRYG